MSGADSARGDRSTLDLHAMRIAVARGRVLRTMSVEGKLYSLPSEDGS